MATADPIATTGCCQEALLICSKKDESGLDENMKKLRRYYAGGVLGCGHLIHKRCLDMCKDRDGKCFAPRGRFYDIIENAPAKDRPAVKKRCAEWVQCPLCRVSCKVTFNNLQIEPREYQTGFTLCEDQASDRGNFVELFPDNDPEPCTPSEIQELLTEEIQLDINT